MCTIVLKLIWFLPCLLLDVLAQHETARMLFALACFAILPHSRPAVLECTQHGHDFDQHAQQRMQDPLAVFQSQFCAPPEAAQFRKLLLPSACYCTARKAAIASLCWRSRCWRSSSVIVCPPGERVAVISTIARATSPTSAVTRLMFSCSVPFG